MYVVISLEDPILTQEELEQSCLLTVSLRGLHALPAEWLADASKIEDEEERDRDEAMSKSKKSKKVKQPKDKKKGKSSKKEDEEETEKIIKNLYTIDFSLPDGDNLLGLACSHTVDRLVLPSSELLKAGLITRDASLASLMGDTGRDSQKTTARSVSTTPKLSSSSSNKGGKTNRKAEQERLLKLREEQEAQEKENLEHRQANRYVALNYTIRRLLTQDTFQVFKDSVLNEDLFSIKVGRSLIEVKLSDDDEGGMTKTTRSDGSAGQVLISFRPFLKAGETVTNGTFPVELVSTEESKLTATGDEENVFGEAGTYLVADISLSRPVVPEQFKPKLYPYDLVPPRAAPQFQKMTAVEEVRHSIADILKDMAGEYNDVVTEQKTYFDKVSSNGNMSLPLASEMAEDRHKSLLYQLNKSGKYHEFKERLKPAIVKLLRSTNLQQTHPDTDPQAQLRMFSKLFSSLVQETHLTLNTELSSAKLVASSQLDKQQQQQQQQGSTANSSSSSSGRELKKQTAEQQAAHLKVLAVEAEIQGNVVAAIERHEARVSLPPVSEPQLRDINASPVDYPIYEPDAHLATCWYEFATFCLRSRMKQKGEEYLRKAISVDETHCDSLKAYACLLLEREDHEQAEVFLRAVKELNPASPLLYALYGLYYDLVENEDQKFEAWRCEHVRRSRQLFGNKTYRSQRPTPRGKPVTPLKTHRENYDVSGMPPKSIYVEVSQYLLSLHCTVLAEKVLQQDAEAETDDARAALWRLIELGELYRVKQDYTRVEQYIGEAFALAVDEGQAVRGFAILGHVYYLQNRLQEAQTAYENYLEWEPRSMDPVLLWRLGEIYSEQTEYEKLRNVYLELGAVHPCASSWLGVGVACLGLRDYKSAQRALQQANLLDKKNPRVWGYLTLVSLLVGQTTQANIAFKHTLELDMQDADLFRNIAMLYLKKGLLEAAETAVTESIRLEDHAQSHILAGDIHWANNLFEAQCTEYQRAFDGADDPQVRTEASQRLVQSLKYLRRDKQLQRHERQLADYEE
jgi:tetratricopeptide (TPR) repeat protein